MYEFSYFLSGFCFAIGCYYLGKAFQNEREKLLAQLESEAVVPPVVDKLTPEQLLVHEGLDPTNQWGIDE